MAPHCSIRRNRKTTMQFGERLRPTGLKAGI
jgi:hypothetical protein